MSVEKKIKDLISEGGFELRHGPIDQVRKISQETLHVYLGDYSTEQISQWRDYPILAMSVYALINELGYKHVSDVTYRDIDYSTIMARFTFIAHHPIADVKV